MFSYILAKINSIKQSRKQGDTSSGKQRIKLDEIKADFSRMKRLHDNVLSQMSSEKCHAFAKEIEQFLQIMNKLYFSENGLKPSELTELEDILEETRNIRDNVKSAAKRITQSNSETDNQL